MSAHAEEYVRELYENVNAVDPIRTTHAVFGRTLHRIPGIVAARRLDSVNVRGPETEDQQWQKLAPSHSRATIRRPQAPSPPPPPSAPNE
jgi:hypothetical protein